MDKQQGPTVETVETENYIQYSMINHMETILKSNVYTCITELLCCITVIRCCISTTFQ